jgi:hypothetical protein
MTQTASDGPHSIHDQTWLDARVRTWVEAGLITDDEGAAVERFEQHAAAQVPGTALGLPAEVSAYVGLLLALAGSIVALRPNWRDMSLVAQLGLAVCVTVVGFACGAWLMRIDEAGTRRLGSVLWVLGSGGAALGSALVVDAAEPVRDAWMALAAGLALFTTGLALWRNLDRPLQLGTWMAGWAASLAAAGALLGYEPWLIGCIGWVLAAGWWFLTFEVTVRPLIAARCFGSAAALVSAFMLADLDQRLGSIAATLTGMIVIALALWTRMIPVLIVGGIGTLIGAQSLMQTTLRGAGAGAALVLGGLVIVAMIALRLRGQSHAT